MKKTATTKTTKRSKTAKPVETTVAKPMAAVMPEVMPAVLPEPMAKGMRKGKGTATAETVTPANLVTETVASTPKAKAPKPAPVAKPNGLLAPTTVITLLVTDNPHRAGSKD